MSFNRGDSIFPHGFPRARCIVCGKQARDNFRGGFSKSAHGRKHVRDKTACEIRHYGSYDYVLTDVGAEAANARVRP